MQLFVYTFAKKKINIVNDFFSGCSRDMKLLLDLLAATSGIAPCLKLLCMFDRNLRKMTEVSNLTIDSYYNSEKNRTEAVVKFDDAPALKDIFVKIRDVQCIYSVVINPPINKVWMIFCGISFTLSYLPINHCPLKPTL